MKVSCSFSCLQAFRYALFIEKLQLRAPGMALFRSAVKYYTKESVTFQQITFSGFHVVTWQNFVALCGTSKNALLLHRHIAVRAKRTMSRHFVGLVAYSFLPVHEDGIPASEHKFPPQCSGCRQIMSPPLFSYCGSPASTRSTIHSQSLALRSSPYNKYSPTSAKS